MKYEELKGLKDKIFKRLIGIKREIFEFQVAILEDALIEKHKRGGRLPKLSLEDILLLFKRLYYVLKTRNVFWIA